MMHLLPPTCKSQQKMSTMMPPCQLSALSQNKGGLSLNWGSMRKPLKQPTEGSGTNMDLSFKPLTSIVLKDALVSHLLSMQHIKPYWFPILIDKKDENGTIFQTSGLSKFLGYDDSMALEYLCASGLIKYIPHCARCMAHHVGMWCLL